MSRANSGGNRSLVRNDNVATVFPIPCRTGKGIIWTKPISVRSKRSSDPAAYHKTICYCCELFEACQYAVEHGDFIGCEWPLERELQ